MNMLQPALAPRDGRTLRVLGVARISTEHQDARSLDDQRALIERYVHDHYDGPIEFKLISSRGSGETLDRSEIREAESLVESGQLDLVIAEDLARIFRRIHAMVFIETCEDFGARVIAINDNVDSGQSDWRLGAFFATFRHEQYNADTGKRIRRSLRNRFQQGGVFQYPIYGYVKPEGATTDDEIQKDLDAEPIYDHWFQMLEDGASFAEVADWLNARDVPTGPYCREPSWNGTMVGRITRNPILKGLRVRNAKVARRVNATGRRRSVAAPPEERLERWCPHLAFIEPDRFDRVVALVNARNAHYRRGKNGADPCANRPRRRTRWPGQHIYCGICGRLLRYGGHGQSDHLLCHGAYEYRCWNAVTVDGPLAARKMADAILAAIERLPGFEDELVERVNHELTADQNGRAARLRAVDQRLASTRREQENIVRAIRDVGASPTLSAEVQRIDAQLASLSSERSRLEAMPETPAALPPVSEIRALAAESIRELALDSPEFSRLIRQLISKIVVWPVQLCDGGNIVLRGRFQLRLASLLPPQVGDIAEVDEALTRELCVDLFDPPQREAFREQVVAMRAQGMTERDVAVKLGITHTAAQRAAALQRRMDQAGLADPYVSVTEPPDDCGRLRRHRHLRYRFDPLDDVGPA